MQSFKSHFPTLFELSEKSKAKEKLCGLMQLAFYILTATSPREGCEVL